MAGDALIGLLREEIRRQAQAGALVISLPEPEINRDSQTVVSVNGRLDLAALAAAVIRGNRA